MALSETLQRRLAGAHKRVRKLAKVRIVLEGVAGECYLDSDADPAGQGLVDGMSEEREAVAIALLKEEWHLTPEPGMNFALPDYSPGVTYAIAPASVVSTVNDWRILGVSHGSDDLREVVQTMTVWGTIVGTLSDQTDLQAALDSKAPINHNHDGIYSPKLQGITDATTARTLAATDAWKWLRFTAATAVTVTVPANVFAAGDIVYMLQAAEGTVTLAEGAGMALNRPAATLEKGAPIALWFVSPTEADVFGERA